MAHLDRPVFEVLGAPWVDFTVPVGSVTGSIWRREESAYSGSCPALCAIAARYRSLRMSEPAETVAFGMMLFILGSIALIVIGRAGLMAINPGGVLAPRYCFWSPFFWAALPVMWPLLLAAAAPLSHALSALFALGLTAATLPSHLPRRRRFRTDGCEKATEDAALRIICGVEDEPSLQRLFRATSFGKSAFFPWPEFIASAVSICLPGQAQVWSANGCRRRPNLNLKSQDCWVIGKSIRSSRHSVKISRPRASPAGV